MLGIWYASCNDNATDHRIRRQHLLSVKTRFSKCSKIPSFGKITIENKSDEIIRVSLVPVISWNYMEQRTNQTMLRNPDKTFGGNHIL